MPPRLEQKSQLSSASIARAPERAELYSMLTALSELVLTSWYVPSPGPATRAPFSTWGLTDVDRYSVLEAMTPVQFVSDEAQDAPRWVGNKG